MKTTVRNATSSFMLIKKYITTHTTKATCSHSARNAKAQEKPFNMHSMSVVVNTRYGNMFWNNEET